MKALTDKDPMPQGKYKGQSMETVPYWYLLNIDCQPYCNKRVQDYINENREVLELEKKNDVHHRECDE